MRLIDADALRAQIQQDYDLFEGSTYLPDKARRDELGNVLARIINTPTIEAEPVKQGKWTYHKINDTSFGYFKCSNCGNNRWIPNYCPNCGAKMEIKNDE